MPTDPDLISAETLTLAALDLGTSYRFARIVVFDATNLKLAEFAMDFPAFPVPTDVQTAANPIQQAIAASGGTPDHFEVRDRNDAVKLTGTIGAQGSGADLEMAPLAPVSQSQGMVLTNVIYTQTDVGAGFLSGSLVLLTRPAVLPSEAPVVQTIEYEDLVRQAEGARAWGARDWHLEYEFGGLTSREFYRYGNYTP